MEDRIKKIFSKQFGLPKEGFIEPVDFTETKIGFSVYKNRSRKGFKSLFKIYIDNKVLENEEDLKPLIITASYGKKTKDGITIYSNEFKRKVNQPVDLTSTNEFFYNIKTHKFLYKNKEINAIDVLRMVDRWHTKPSKLFKGAFLRLKIIWFRTVLAQVFKFIFNFISKIEHFLSGKKIKIYFNFSEERNEYKNEWIETKSIKTSQDEPIDPINIFGYKVEPQIAFVYSIFHLSLYGIFYKYDYSPIWLITIFKNIFLTVIYVIISIGITKTMLSKLKSSQLLFWILKKIQAQYLKFLSKEIKI